MSNFLYTLGIRAYALSVGLAAPFIPKAKLWKQGRKKWRGNLKENLPTKKGKRIWVHCASLGEFEQGRPIIEALKKQDSSFEIILTFFSPSGYVVRKDYARADFVGYLPADTPQNAKDWLDVVRPDVAVFVKYEFWFNFMAELDQQHISLYSVSAIFRPDQRFFKRGGSFFREGLKQVKWFFVQNEESLSLLKSIGVEQAAVCGDTRFDRVAEIAQQAEDLPDIERFCAGQTTVVAGSTWPAEEGFLAEFMTKRDGGNKLILAPHEIGPAHIASILKEFGSSAVLYSDWIKSKDAAAAKDILVIDNIGMLSKLYSFADVAIVGGAFGAGLHNILEAATYGVPIVFGPKYERFQEAVDLVAVGGAYTVSDKAAFQRKLQALLTDSESRAKAAKAAKAYVERKTGATEVIVAALLKQLH